jgi:hypothetical protein
MVDEWLGTVRRKAIEVVMTGSGEVTLKVNNHVIASVTQYAAQNKPDGADK